MIQYISYRQISVSSRRGCIFERGVAGWGWMWLQQMVWWVTSPNRDGSNDLQVSQKHQANTLMKTISHPPIAAPHRHWCNKEVRGLENVGGSMWQIQLTLLRGHRDVDAKASNGEWQIWSLLSQLILTHLVAAAQCRRWYCCDGCAIRFVCCKS